MLALKRAVESLRQTKLKRPGELPRGGDEEDIQVIDLHTHSTESDGTDSPEELADAAAARGLTVFALTDHETTAGVARAQRRGSIYGIRVVSGIELSARHDGRDVHILGYFVDETSPSLAAVLAPVRESRRNRAPQIVERLQKDFPIRWEDVTAQAGNPDTIGRPHIADALVRLGVVPGRPEAFETLLHSSSPYVVPLHAPKVEEAIAAIREAGGVPVLAHPGATTRGGGALLAKTIELWASEGLRGLEVNHRENSPQHRYFLLDLASRLNLIVTGGSDYHGRGKPNLLGENVTEQPALDLLFEHASAAASASGEMT